MKREAAKYVARFLECKEVKVVHQHPALFFHPIPIPEWNWETTTMDFITMFPLKKTTQLWLW